LLLPAVSRLALVGPAASVAGTRLTGWISRAATYRRSAAGGTFEAGPAPADERDPV
jgi:hypothetical protein